MTKKTENNTRASRETDTREKQARRKPWSAPSALDAPPPPEGYRDGSHPSMSVSKPNRQSRVTLGGKRAADKA